MSSQIQIFRYRHIVILFFLQKRVVNRTETVWKWRDIEYVGWIVQIIYLDFVFGNRVENKLLSAVWNWEWQIWDSHEKWLRIDLYNILFESMW